MANADHVGSINGDMVDMKYSILDPFADVIDSVLMVSVFPLGGNHDSTMKLILTILRQKLRMMHFIMNLTLI